MAVLPEEISNPLKDKAYPLFFVCLTNQNTSSGEVIGNGLILSLPEKKRSRD